MSFGEIVAVVQTCGRVVESDEFQGTIGAIVMSGCGGMNPSVLAISVVNQRIYIRAYAKEGLIKQHTAEKAIKRLTDILAKEQ